MHSRRRCVAGLAVLALAGCAGNGEGLDASGRPVGPGGPGDGPLVATFDSIQAKVFTPICTACHAGATAPQGLRLDAASSYDLLVGVSSNEVSSLKRVLPGDPDHSYLVQKLEGRASVGARMPLGGPYLDAATIAVIRQWITDGAPRTAAAAATSKPFAVASTSPANGDRLPRSPTQLVLAFTRDVDATRLDASLVRLSRVAEDGSVLEVQAASVSSVPSNPRVLVVTPRTALAAGRHALQVDATALADLEGHAITGAPGAAPAGVRVVFDVEASR